MGFRTLCYIPRKEQNGKRKNCKVMTEITAAELLTPVHYAKELTYLKLSGLKPGLLLLLNVNSKTLKDSIHSVVNTL
jgi:hypothetical protein